ncbi:MAG: dienelactone hydrolase family protein [Ferrovibrio sp.]|uniref:alpha/beta hydrolase n=1 Tax=Ferrovibrio sp. TaxID=1917215 RepID=UPI00261D2D0B|nr:dienelactone hydrolase family protein [Ferrovibrio sp.]MCW0232403.1 dienelactone hydrolase family protein [Ferrovibrio sp.]
MSIDGPRLAPLKGPARKLVVLVHGYGADGDDLIELGAQWRNVLPDAAFAAPHAPAMIPGFPPGMAGGRQWFALDAYDPNLLRRDPHQTAAIYATMQRAAEQVAPALEQFLDAELKRYNLDPGDLALVGFSQGTMMALHIGLRRDPAPAAILGYSGALLGGAGLEKQIRSRPPILLIHGDADEIVPIEAMHAALNALNAAGCPARFHVSRGLGHGIDGQGLSLGGAFLAESFARPR